MTGIMAALAGATGTSILDTQTVTRGFSSTGSNPSSYYSGYSASPVAGSISDGTSNLYSGATISQLCFYESAYTSPPNGIVARQIIFKVGSVVANSGWSAVVIGSTLYYRSDAIFTTGSGFSQWTWVMGISDPFVSGDGDPFTSSTTVKWY